MKIGLLQILSLILFACEYNNVQPDNSPCNLKPDPGNCYALFTKYYYDRRAGECRAFTWGGCGGVVPFHTMEECRACEQSR